MGGNCAEEADADSVACSDGAELVSLMRVRLRNLPRRALISWAPTQPQPDQPKPDQAQPGQPAPSRGPTAGPARSQPQRQTQPLLPVRCRHDGRVHVEAGPGHVDFLQRLLLLHTDRLGTVELQ